MTGGVAKTNLTNFLPRGAFNTKVIIQFGWVPTTTETTARTSHGTKMTKRTNGKEPTSSVSREDSLSKWAANALPHLGSSLDPALDYKLEDLATQQQKSSSGNNGGFASVRVREVTEGLRKQCSKIDAGLFDGLPKEAGNQTMGDVWAGIVASGGATTGGGASGADKGQGHGRLAIGGTSGKANAASAAAMGSLMSLPSMSTWTAMQFVTAMASVGEGANAQAETTTKSTNTTTTAKRKRATTKSTATKNKKKTDENDAPSGKPSRVLVPVVPGVSYEPKKLKHRSNIPTPTVREALAPRKMGRRPKNAPKETDEEKQQRLAERLFRNRESAARSRERRQNAMQVLQDENEALRKEVAALKAKLAKLKK